MNIERTAGHDECIHTLQKCGSSRQISRWQQNRNPAGFTNAPNDELAHKNFRLRKADFALGRVYRPGRAAVAGDGDQRPVVQKCTRRSSPCHNRAGSSLSPLPISPEIP